MGLKIAFRVYYVVSHRHSEVLLTKQVYSARFTLSAAILRPPPAPYDHNTTVLAEDNEALQRAYQRSLVNGAISVAQS